MLRTGADTAGVVARGGKHHGLKVDRSFGRAVHGFSAKLDKQQERDLLADPNVLAVVPDGVIQLAQTIPTGVSRVGGQISDVADIDGSDQRVDADVAIVDTGIAQVPDLNVAGGYNCSSSDRTAWRDKNNHGTHVAGHGRRPRQQLRRRRRSPRAPASGRSRSSTTAATASSRGTSAAWTGSSPSATRTTPAGRCSRPST